MSSDSNSSGGGGGIGFVGCLQIVFIVLKLCGVINWKWVWVLCPLWGSTVFWLLFLFIMWLIYRKGW